MSHQKDESGGMSRSMSHMRKRIYCTVSHGIMTDGDAILAAAEVFRLVPDLACVGGDGC